MSDIGLAESTARRAGEAPASFDDGAGARLARRRSDPATLLRLASPNVVALSACVCVVIAETSYIGRLGSIADDDGAGVSVRHSYHDHVRRRDGGGVTWRSRARSAPVTSTRLDARPRTRVLIRLTFGPAFMFIMLLFGPALLRLLGGRGKVLAQAIGYVQIFSGASSLPR